MVIARNSIMHSGHMLSPVRLSVCSVCLSHGWISQKRLKLGSCNFHQFLRYKFNPEILTGSPRAGASNKGGVKNKQFSRFTRRYLENGTRYDQSYYALSIGTKVADLG